MSQKFVSFKWKDLIYQFLCLWFGLAPAPRKFTKLPISLERKLNIRLIIFLDDILLMAASVEELTLVRDTLIYLLQRLESSVSIRELTQLTVKLASTAIAVLPASLQYQSMQRQQNLNGVICSRKLQLRNKIIRQGEDRIGMVGTASSLTQWEVSCILSYQVNNSLRCIFTRLVCILSRTQNRDALDIIRKKRSYTYVKTESSKICNLNFHSLVPNCKNGQMDNVVVFT